jgi:hypothetical protein
VITYHLCSNEWLWSQYTLFYLRHRQEIIADYKMEYVIQDIVRYMDDGHAILALNEMEEVIAITACYYGLPDPNQVKKDTAVLHNSYVLPKYQTSRVFLRGLTYNVEEIGKARPQVTEVRMHAGVNKPYLHRIYSKIAQTTGFIGDSSNLFTEFVTSYEDLSRYCRQFDRQPLPSDASKGEAPEQYRSFN